LLKSGKDFNIVNESPDCFNDAVKTKKVFEGFGVRFG